jgi:hypothetical protein
MPQVMLFFSALIAHWLFTFGGVALVLFGLYEKSRHKETHKRVYWGVAVILLFVASYQAWLDEHHNAEAVIRDKMQLAVDNGGLKQSVGDKDSEIEYLRTHQVISVTPTINIPSTHPLPELQLTKLESSYTATDEKGNSRKVAFVPGKTVSFNLYYTNKGNGVAHESIGVGKVYIASEDNPETQHKLTNDFRRVAAARLKKASTPISLSVGESFWFTAESDHAIDNSDVTTLKSGPGVIYLFSYVKYKDEAGDHYIEGCRVTQTPAFSPEVWHFCLEYEKQR